MKCISSLLAAVAVAVSCGALVTPSAQAKTYDFTFTGGAVSINNGVFTTSNVPNGDGTHNILTATGVIAGLGAFTMTPGNGALLFTGDGTENYSNLYTPGASSFALAGLEVQGTGFEANLYNAINASYPKCGGTDCLSLPGSNLYDPGQAGVVSITAVPEPATWAMMLLGLFGLGAAVRQRKIVLAA